MKFAQFVCLSTLTVASATKFNLRRRTEACTPCFFSGFQGVTACVSGFTACIDPEEHETPYTCGACPEVEEVEDTRQTVLFALDEEPPLCADVAVEDRIACTLDDGSDGEGALVCKLGFSVCLKDDEIEDDYPCGCCPGDDSPRCQLSEEDNEQDGLLLSNGILGESLLGSTSLCNATSYACNITDGSDSDTLLGVGATVCRYGFTACISPEALEVTDECGECPEVLLPEQIRGDADGLILALDASCTEETIAKYDCVIPDTTEHGVYRCKSGFTACVSVDMLEEDDHCGCCPGVDHEGCETTSATSRQFNPDVEFP